MATLNYIRGITTPIDSFVSEESREKVRSGATVFDIINFENYRNLYCFNNSEEFGNMPNSLKSCFDNKMLKYHPLNNTLYFDVQSPVFDDSGGKSETVVNSQRIQPWVVRGRSRTYRDINKLSSMSFCEMLLTSNFDILAIHPLKNNLLLTEEYTDTSTEQIDRLQTIRAQQMRVKRENDRFKRKQADYKEELRRAKEKKKRTLIIY